MDDGLKKMSISKKRWPQMKKMLEKSSTRLVLLEVPKGMALTDNELIEKLNLGERLKKAEKS